MAWRGVAGLMVTPSAPFGRLLAAWFHALRVTFFNHLFDVSGLTNFNFARRFSVSGFVLLDAASQKPAG